MKLQQGAQKACQNLETSSLLWNNFVSLRRWKQKTSVLDLSAGDENMACEIDFCQTDYFATQYRFQKVLAIMDAT